MWGIRRLRFATGVDDDLRPFHEAYRDDPVLGRALRANPALRVRRAPLPWESLAAAITEQLIEFERAVAIQRRLIAALGRRCPRTGLRDAPAPGTVAAAAPARLAAFDLSPSRALTLRRAAAEVAAGRVDLLAGDPMPGWRRLRAIPGIGPWTLEVLALYGQGLSRPGAGRRPRLPQARRTRAHGQPARAGGGGGGARVLRPLRRVEGAGGGVPALRGGLGPPRRQSRPGSSPSPGRNSFVIAREPGCGCVISRFERIQAA
jgi:hypothetical protein